MLNCGLEQFTRRRALSLLGFLAAASCKTSPQSIAEPRRRVADALTPFPLRDVRMGGYLGRKIDLCIHNRILAVNADKLIEPFRHRDERQCWQTEFWGKWFLSAAAAHEYKPDEDWGTRLPDSVHELLKTQSPDGYIGNYATNSRLKSWDVWGRKYTLLGLLARFHDTQDRAALDAARKLADHLLTEVGPGKADIVTLGLYRGMAASSVLEPMVAMYRQTGDERYAQFCEYILAQWSSAKGPQLIEKAGVPVGDRFPRAKKWWSWDNGEKAYEMLSCYAGLLDLYRETGRAAYLDAARRTFESVRDTEINIAGSGSSDECWYGGAAHQSMPAHHTMETCVATSWMQFSSNLLRTTGDSRIADEIEKTAYNALLGAMKPDGSSFAQYSSLEGVREFGSPQCNMDLNCCIANGPRGLMFLPEMAVMMSAEGPVVNLYSEGRWKFRLPSGASGQLEVATKYPASDQVDIQVHLDRPEAFPLRLRIPAWSTETSLAVNGSAVKDVRPGAYAQVEMPKTAVSRLRLSLDLRGRMVRSPDGSRAAILRGPIALASDARLGQSGTPNVAKGSVLLKAVTPPAGIETALAGPDGLLLCDYASAGNTWDERSRFQAWFPFVQS